MKLYVTERLVMRKVMPLLCTITVAVIICKLYTLDQKRDYQKYSKIETTRYSRPNILFIVADDLGYNDVSYHGSEIKTPNLDALAISGVRLENYYVQPICTPTRSQLLSGRYQIHTGLQHGITWHTIPIGLPLDSKTMADKLSDAGYSTHIVGKWHLGFYKKEYLPTRRGFHSFFRSTLKSYTGFDSRENEEPADVKKYSGTYSTELFAEKVIDLFQRNDTGKPLFVYLPFQAVHRPLQVPEQYLRQYDFIKSDSRRKHAAMVSCMDEAIGNITKALKEMGKWNNTLLIFSTDNGGQLGDGSNWPLRGFKGNHWEGGIRAVGFVHGNLLQDNIRGTVSRDLLHVTDWFPTLVNLAGGDLNGTKPLDGYNHQGKPSKRGEFLINIDPECVAGGRRLFNGTFDTNIYAGLRQGKWKLVTGVTEGRGLPRKKDGTNHWLFNIKNDPNEQRDLSRKYPELVRSMLNRLEYYQSTAVPVLNTTMDPNADPKLHGGFWGPWKDDTPPIRQILPDIDIESFINYVKLISTIFFNSLIYIVVQ